jgi:hypothetical protein
MVRRAARSTLGCALLRAGPLCRSVSRVGRVAQSV